MTTIVVLGAGRMGTAVTWPLCDNGHRVLLVGTHLDREIIRSCKEARYHPGLRRRIPDVVEPLYLEDLGAALTDAGAIVSGVNSLGVHWAGRTLAPLLRPGAAVLSLTKGVETGSDGVLRVLPDVLSRELPADLRPRVTVAGVAGPVLAYELAGRRPSGTIFAGRDADREALLQLRMVFHRDYYRVWLSTDLVGVELYAALKNAYTIAVGAAGGMYDGAGGPDETGAAMHNLAAMLFGAAAFELFQIVKLMGGRAEGFAGLHGAGDLYVTCTGGRTYRLGRLMGRGLTFSQAQTEMQEDTLEGAFAVQQMAAVLPAWEAEGRVRPHDLPLLRALILAITTDTPLLIPWDDLMGTGQAFV